MAREVGQRRRSVTVHAVEMPSAPYGEGSSRRAAAAVICLRQARLFYRHDCRVATSRAFIRCVCHRHMSDEFEGRISPRHASCFSLLPHAVSAMRARLPRHYKTRRLTLRYVNMPGEGLRQKMRAAAA